jgi:predicted metal-dependent peptidase
LTLLFYYYFQKHEALNFKKDNTMMIAFKNECDTQIHNKYVYTGHPPEVVSGRGGTAFDAPIEYANDTYLPDAVVYFTDGYAPAPTVICRKPILWMVTSEGIEEDAWDFLPGRKVKMVKQLG